ncbi:MAG: hypothetical protein ABIQ93_13460 [Saprospiraceae bacterium]
MRNICLFLLGFLPALLAAQTDDLSASLPFFSKTARQYQRWLDATGLGRALKVDSFQLKKNNTELELLLLLRTNDPDTAVALWKNINQNFPERGGDTLALENELFQTFARQMQIPPDKGNVQIYIRDKHGMYIPCFYVWIWSDEGVLKTEVRLNECKAKIFEVTIKPVAVRQTAKGKKTTLPRKVQPNEVFDEILRFAREQYEVTTCYDRSPKVEVDYQKTKNNTLEFTVTDLCRVVLSDEQSSTWCNILQKLGYPCNDARRERLVFSFTYIPTDTGYQLSCRLQGLFGSGVYKPRVSGYMDMEPDFDDYLNAYVNGFQNRLTERLQKKP